MTDGKLPGLLEGTLTLPQAIRVHGESMSPDERRILARDLLKMNKVSRRPAALSLQKRVGSWIRTSRKERELSQALLADAIGLGRPALANMEAGKQSITVEMFVVLCSELGKDPVDTLWKLVDTQ